MKLHKIKFTAWKDKPFHPSPEFEPLLRQIDETTSMLHTQAVDLQAAQKISASDLRTTRLSEIGAELDIALARKRALIQERDREARDAHDRARTHPRAGTFGYQIIDEHIGEVMAIVDEAGDPLPVNAVHEHEIIDTDPPVPTWAEAAPGRPV